MPPDAEEHLLSLTLQEVFLWASLAAIVLGVVVALARNHIDRRVDSKLSDHINDMEMEVEAEVTRQMAGVHEKLDAIALNIRETNAAVGKVHQLDTLIRNGMTSRMTRIEHTLDTVLAQMLGPYTGPDRRAGDAI